MIIKAFDFLPVGGIDQNTAVFYSEEQEQYYSGKSLTRINPKNYAITVLTAIMLYSLVRFLNNYVTVVGVFPLLICFLLAFIASKLFLSRIAKMEYEVEVLEFSREQELLFMEGQLKKQLPLKVVLAVLPIITLLVSVIYLHTGRFLWLFSFTLLTWASCSTVCFFGKVLYNFNKHYKKVKEIYDKTII